LHSRSAATERERAGHILELVEFKHLLYARRDAVATITLNRPDHRNALSTETVAELREALKEAKGEAQARVIVITGAGKVFCAGADLNSFLSEQPELDRYLQRRPLADLFLEMTELGKPTIARVNGHALAGGFGLVAACDLAIAADGAQFGMPEVNVGVFPMLIMAIVFRNLPRKAAMELMLTGKRIDAAEATRLGLINRNVPAERLDQEVDALAAELAKKSPIGMKLGLEAFYRMQDMSFPSAIEYLNDQLAILSLSDDLKEGVTAFFEKREPRFTGR
jgi:enoyl-CoA hydratase